MEAKKPNKFKLREWIAWILVKIAQKIYPESDAVKAFYLQLYHDQIIYGKSIVRINPEDLYEL